MLTDLRYAWRAMWKSAPTTIGAMLALAIGIGATTAVFGLLNAVLLRPLPYPEADRLVELYGTVQREEVERRGASFADFFDWRDQAQSFDGMAAWYAEDAVLYGGREPEPVSTEVTSGPYFPLLGVTPVLGRALAAADDDAGAARAAVIGERLWERAFGRRGDVIGQALQLDDRAYTIVGVAPAAFRGRSDDAEIWVSAAGRRPPEDLQNRGDRWFPVLARLAPGVRLETAQAELDAISRRLEQAYPRTNEKRGVEISPLAREVFGDLRRAAAVLSGAVLLVLLIACANVASLLLARTEERRRELSVRLALGANRRRLSRLLLAESAWLVVLGGGAGWLMALWASDALLALSPVQLPSFAAPGLDWRMLVFASLLGALTTIGVAVAPAMVKTPVALSRELREGAAETRGSGRSRAIRIVVVAEVALAVTLLVGATLLTRSLGSLLRFDPGFETDGVLALGVQLPFRAAEVPVEPGLVDAGGGVRPLALLETLRSIPGVSHAALASDLPLGGANANFYTAEGHPVTDAQTRPRAFVHRVTPGYFDAIGLRLTAGRDFSDAELGGQAPAVIVSAALARRFWPGQDPVGRRIKRGAPTSTAPWLTIVGVVEDASLRAIPRNPTADPDFYVPFAADTQAFAAVVRTGGEALRLAAPVRDAIRRFDPAIAVTTVETMEARVAEQLAPVRFLSWLTGTFASIALTLALIGIYAVLAHAVRKRRREIGIRSALGAPRSRLVGLVVVQGLALVAGGLALGLALASGLSRGLDAYLFSVSAADPVSYGVVAAAVLACAVLACVLPALRAVRVNPMIALRNE